MSKGAQILAAERLLGRFEAFSIGDKHEVRGEHATVEPVDFSASPYAADHANVVPDDFRLDVRDEEFLQTECFVVRRSHRTPPALFLSPKRQSCVGNKTQRKLNLFACTPENYSLRSCSEREQFARLSAYAHQQSIADSFSTPARLSPAGCAPAAALPAPMSQVAAGATNHTGAACLS